VGAPIGHANRRFFIQYLLWSALLCAFGGALALHEVLTRWPSHLALASGADADASDAWERLRLLCAFVSPAFATAMRWLGVGLQSELAAQIYACVLDGMLCVGLGTFGAHHVRLVLRNVTTLESWDRQYDVGRAANWTQLCGRRVAAWILPLDAVGAGDGVHYPRAAGA